MTATLLMGGAVSLSLLWGFQSKTETRTINRTIVARGTPCVRMANGRPSPGCERLARLLIQTCVLNPDLCANTVRQALEQAPPSARSQIAAAVKQALSTGSQPKRKKSGGGVGGGGGSSTTPPSIAPPATQPPATGSVPSPSQPGPVVPAPPRGPTPRPSPSDVANNAAKRATDTANDVTGAVGAGRPVPDPPAVPALPPLPCMPTLITKC